MKNIKKFELLEKIVTDMNSAMSADELLNYLIDKAIEMTGALTGSIMLINPETKVLDIKVFRGLKKDKITTTKLKVGEGVTGHVAQTGTPVLVGDADKVDYYIRVREDLKSELALPLKIENKIVGVISVDSSKKNAFNEEHMDILNTLSKVASQILYKANLFAELKLTIENQEILLKIASILEKTMEIGDIFARVMKIISTTFQISRGILALLDENNNLKVFAGYRLSKEAMQRGNYKIGEGVMGRVVGDGQSIAIEDISQNKDFLNRMKIRRGRNEKNSFFAVPLKYENKTVGVLGIEKKYINKNFFKDTQKLITLIATLISQKVHNYEVTRQEKEILIKKNLELKEELLGKESDVIFIGKNQKILDIMDTIDMVADTDASVLILGQTGTGKEILARLVHYKSKRWDKPFISINCASIPENLLESELFGYKKGAFTGAVSDKKGKFLLADEGTIFLDEIGDLNFPLQAKILRALQERIIEPLGSEKEVKINVRVVAATNKDLESLVKEKQFREDLFYRLNVIPLKIPSLSERKDDILLLINHFIKIYNAKYGKNIGGLTERCKEALLNYAWPGNIRELENVLERAVILSKTKLIDVSLLQENISKTVMEEEKDIFVEFMAQEIQKAEKGEIYKDIVGKIEKYLVEYALVESNNKQSKASGLLGLHRNTLRAKIKEFEL